MKDFRYSKEKIEAREAVKNTMLLTTRELNKKTKVENHIEDAINDYVSPFYGMNFGGWLVDLSFFNINLCFLQSLAKRVGNIV